MAKTAPAGWYASESGRMRWWDGKAWTDRYQDDEGGTPPADTSTPLYSFVSHIDGKNAKVEIFQDRIEWERKAVSGGKVAAGILTMGMSTVFTGVRGKNTDMVPIRMVTAVTSKKGVGLNTVVHITTAGGALEFRTGHKEAEQVKQLVLRLIQEAAQPQTVVVQAPAAAAVPDVAAQLHQLAGLHDAGVLTDAEFEAKKAELLARM